MGRARINSAAEKGENKVSGKEYQESIEELAKKTAVRPTDFDDKAVKYLDFVQENGGRGKEACEYLATALEGLARDHVSNWKAYVYTLLRGFDSKAYEEMKTAEGRKARNPRVGIRHPPKEKKAVPSDFNFNAEAVEFVPGGGNYFMAPPSPPPPP
ncbi:unnamed protein product, partial [Polarella glacialis]